MGYKIKTENPFRNDLLVALRNSRGWSQEELGKRARLTQRAISKIESGHDPKASTVGRLASALGVNPKIFFDSKYRFTSKATGARQATAQAA